MWSGQLLVGDRHQELRCLHVDWQRLPHPNRLRDIVIVAAKTRCQMDRPALNPALPGWRPPRVKAVLEESDDASSRFTHGDPTTRVKVQKVQAARCAAIGGEDNVAPIRCSQCEIVVRGLRRQKPRESVPR